jgi:RNA polymerase sigma-70 factor (sigma-E family)
VLLGCSPQEAEDIVQTALTRCLVKWRKVQRASDRDAYVHRVLINVFISSRRRRWTRETPVPALPDHSGPDETTAIDQADAVMRSLDRLTSDQRAVVILRYYSHFSEVQTAAILGVATGTVKSRLSRALKRLAEDPHLETLRGAQ